jgi:hypothetical protein
VLTQGRAGAPPGGTGELRVPPPISALASSSATTSLYSSKQQGDIALKAHVPSLRFKCFRCFIWTLHVFHLNVAKVDRYVAHVEMAIHVCCNFMFQTFQLFFRSMLQVYVSAVSEICCKWFYLNVAYVAVATHVCCKRMF